jgi:hypothetical protein
VPFADYLWGGHPALLELGGQDAHPKENPGFQDKVAQLVRSDLVPETKTLILPPQCGGRIRVLVFL